jgi:hypothetical protein
MRIVVSPAMAERQISITIESWPPLSGPVRNYLKDLAVRQESGGSHTVIHWD